MKKIIVVFFAFAMVSVANAQNVLFTKAAQVKIFSTTPMENIEGLNKEASCMLNKSNGDMVFSMKIKGFHFPQSLMEEHFNENYMDSEKFPSSVFKGRILDVSKVDFTKDGVYPVQAEGDMTIHGVTKKVTSSGTITVKEGKVSAHSEFKVKPQDYDIKIPTIVVQKIAELIEVTVDAPLDPYVKQ